MLTVTIPINDLNEKYHKIQRKVGKGATSTILLACNNKNDEQKIEEFALKIYFGTTAADHCSKVEIATLKFLSNFYSFGHYAGTFIWSPQSNCHISEHLQPNVERYPLDKSYQVLVTRYVPGSPLSEMGHLKTNPEQLNVLLKSALQYLKKLHDYNFAHRDVKGDNLIINGNDAVLIDYGYAVYNGLTSPHVLSSETLPHVGTPLYISPEFAETLVKHEFLSFSQWQESDLWSLGLAFQSVITGEDPHFGATRLRHVFKKLDKYVGPPLMIYDQDTEVDSLLKILLSKDGPSRRRAYENM